MSPLYFRRGNPRDPAITVVKNSLSWSDISRENTRQRMLWLLHSCSQKQEQLRAFEKIRKEGIFKVNVSMMEKGQILIRERRQGSSNNADLRMCNSCRGFFDRKQIYRHKKRCVMHQGPLVALLTFLHLGKVQNLWV